MARKSAAEKAAERAAVGHNLPKASDYDGYFDRLHEINDRLDEDSATHRGDMNSVYEEAATALNMPKEVVAALYKQDRKERKAAKKFAKADQVVREAFQKAADAYGAESPLGQWAGRMAKAAGVSAAANIAENNETEETVEKADETAETE